MKRILDSGALGRVTHVLAEAYGPVVLRAKRQSWRTQKEEGGGCLYDYAAHPLNLAQLVLRRARAGQRIGPQQRVLARHR